MLLRVDGCMGHYLLIALGRTFQKGRLGSKPSTNVLLRVGGGMGCHLLIALSRHSKREDFGGLLGVLLLYSH